MMSKKRIEKVSEPLMRVDSISTANMQNWMSLRGSIAAAKEGGFEELKKSISSSNFQTLVPKPQAPTTPSSDGAKQGATPKEK
jgi:hypothetical protein